MSPDRHRRENTYVLTNDIGERIQSLQLLGIRTPAANDPIFVAFHDELKSRITAMHPDLDVLTYNMGKLADEVWTQAIQKKSSLKDALILSSCAEVATARRGHTIEINRIVDSTGKPIGLGPRPHNPSLDQQMTRFAGMANGNPVVLVEDGIFTGGTLEFVIKKLRSKGVNVQTIVAGLAFPAALERLKQWFEGDIVIMKEIGEPREWMPDHDFIPFTPNCGRVFGGVFGNEALPFYTHEGFAYSFPYIRPFGDPEHWASIPAEHVFEFSMFCMETARTLFSRLDELNGRQITMHDLVGSKPSVCLPMSAGSSQLPHAEEPISSFLSTVCHELV